MSVAELEAEISTLNYFKTKAAYIHGCAHALRTHHRGEVPRTQKALEKLPGVGPKARQHDRRCFCPCVLRTPANAKMLPLQVSLLVLSVGFAMGDAGIVVDTHVHRVARRLGWGRGGVVGGAGGGPEGTRRAMQALLPKEDWAEVTLLLVGFGQQTCTARAPKCAECPVAQRCPSSQAKQKPSEDRLRWHRTPCCVAWPRPA